VGVLAAQAEVQYGGLTSPNTSAGARGIVTDQVTFDLLDVRGRRPQVWEQTNKPQTVRTFPGRVNSRSLPRPLSRYAMMMMMMMMILPTAGTGLGRPYPTLFYPPRPLVSKTASNPHF
jgi:hypothetical protein